MTTTTTRPQLAVDSQRVWDLGYELLDYVGSTEQANIWEVRHRKSYESFAWKQLRPECESDSVACQALQNEFAVSRLVKSAYLPKIVAARLDETPRYFISEWFSRDNLEQVIQEFGPLPIGLCLWITRQCAQGLQDLHQAGLTHGDLLPKHVLIRENGTVCLTELTLSRRVAGGSGAIAPRRPLAPNGPLEDYAAVTATHQPPQGVVKDLHGLGVILYRILTAHYPFEPLTAAEMIQASLAKPEVTLRRLRADVSEKIAVLVGELLSPHPAQRPGGAAVLVQRLMELELEQFLLADPSGI